MMLKDLLFCYLDLGLLRSFFLFSPLLLYIEHHECYELLAFAFALEGTKLYLCHGLLSF